MFNTYLCVQQFRYRRSDQLPKMRRRLVLVPRKGGLGIGNLPFTLSKMVPPPEATMMIPPFTAMIVPPPETAKMVPPTEKVKMVPPTVKAMRVSPSTTAHPEPLRKDVHVPLGVLISYEGMSWTPEPAPCQRPPVPALSQHSPVLASPEPVPSRACPSSARFSRASFPCAKADRAPPEISAT